MCCARPISATFLVLVATCGAACGDPGEAAPEAPPAAALRHASLSRLGEPVVFDASASKPRADRDLPPDSPLRILKYAFVFGDGTASVESASAGVAHDFPAPGLFQVSVTVWDDLGRSAVATSRVHIAEDFTPTCSDASTDACDSDACAANGSCLAMGCSGAAACPSELSCAAEGCTKHAPPEGDLFTGSDASGTADGLPRAPDAGPSSLDATADAAIDTSGDAGGKDASLPPGDISGG